MFSQRNTNPELQERIGYLALPLAPLVQITTGEAHLNFPRTMLHYHLLVDAELEDLAHFYHQRTPSQWTALYPKPMGWVQGMKVEEKRRKFGKFIGLMGCQTPTKTEEELQDEIWRQAKIARLAAEDDMWRRKREWF